MRLISLNAWCGRALYPLMRFVEKNAADADVFCFQEVCNGRQKIADTRHPNEYVCATMFGKIAKKLDGFDGHFATHPDDPERMSNAMFVRRNAKILEFGVAPVFRSEVPQWSEGKPCTSRLLQYAHLMMRGKRFAVFNCHGLWNGGPKTDVPERIVQSHNIRGVMDVFTAPKILVGDFNLAPGTKSLAILEEGMRNLVTESGATTTRTPHYRHYDDESASKFADYALVSPGIDVRRFEVVQQLASDHAALFLDFDVS